MKLLYFSARDRPRSEGPSSFRQKTVHFNPGSSTFDRLTTFATVHFPPFGPFTFPWLVRTVRYELFILFAARSVWTVRCSHILAWIVRTANAFVRSSVGPDLFQCKLSVMVIWCSVIFCRINSFFKNHFCWKIIEIFRCVVIFAEWEHFWQDP